MRSAYWSGLKNQAGIAPLTGDVGSGKTTLIRKLLAECDQEIVIGLISNTHASFGTLMQWISVAFGLPVGSKSKAALYDKFPKYLIQQYAAGKRTVLIVDEPQDMDATALEELWLLPNINADKDQLIQLVLVGQPELRATLRQGALRQFVQRIGADFDLGPLDASETDEYIRHRLTVAGGDAELFEPVARRFVHYQCGGVPRLFNSLCDTALVYAYAYQQRSISARLVFDIVQEQIKAGLFAAGAAQKRVNASNSAGDPQLDAKNALNKAALEKAALEVGGARARQQGSKVTREFSVMTSVLPVILAVVAGVLSVRDRSTGTLWGGIFFTAKVAHDAIR